MKLQVPLRVPIYISDYESVSCLYSDLNYLIHLILCNYLRVYITLTLMPLFQTHNVVGWRILTSVSLSQLSLSEYITTTRFSYIILKQIAGVPQPRLTLDLYKQITYLTFYILKFVSYFMTRVDSNHYKGYSYRFANVPLLLFR